MPPPTRANSAIDEAPSEKPGEDVHHEDHDSLVGEGLGIDLGVEQEQQSETAEGQAGNRQAHHRAPGEGHLEGVIETRAGGTRGAGVGPGGRPHAEVSGEPRAERSEHEGQSDERVGVLRDVVVGDAENDGDRHHEDRENAVLAPQERHRAIRDPAADELHAFGPWILARHPRRLDEGIDERQHGGRRTEIDEVRRFHDILLLCGAPQRSLAPAPRPCETNHPRTPRWCECEDLAVMILANLEFVNIFHKLLGLVFEVVVTAL